MAGKTLSQRTEEHSDEIHLMRVWTAAASVNIDKIPGLVDDIGALKTGQALQQQSIDSIGNTAKWILRTIVGVAITAGIAYIQMRFKGG